LFPLLSATYQRQDFLISDNAVSAPCIWKMAVIGLSPSGLTLTTKLEAVNILFNKAIGEEG
jgi:hypothetical protein